MSKGTVRRENALKPGMEMEGASTVTHLQANLHFQKKPFQLMMSLVDV